MPENSVNYRGKSSIDQKSVFWRRWHFELPVLVALVSPGLPLAPDAPDPLNLCFNQAAMSLSQHTQDEITCFRISETWRKHATPCFRYVYVKVVRFRCIRSNGNARKRHETGNGNTGYPSCFRNGLTCFCHVSVYGFLQFRPVTTKESFLFRAEPRTHCRIDHLPLQRNKAPS